MAVGNNAMVSATTAILNVAVGRDALDALVDKHYNTAIGYNALTLCTDERNVAVGYGAGGTTVTGGYNVFMGMDAIGSANSNDYEIVIGYNTTGKGTQTGFINPTGGGVYQGNNSADWSTTSDERIKKNIVDNTRGLDAINQIRVRNFEYRTKDEIVDFDNPDAAVVEQEGVQLGVIAQELEIPFPEMVKTESTGGKTVDQNDVTWYLVNAVKELSAEVNKLKEEQN